MRVYRGRLVHCKVPEKVEILDDQLIGFEENERRGTVCDVIMMSCHGSPLYIEGRAACTVIVASIPGVHAVICNNMVYDKSSDPLFLCL